MDCLFCKIVNGELKSKLIYEDQYVVAFDDINPQAPIHKLIIPRMHIATLNDLNSDSSQVLPHIFLAVKHIAKTLAVDETGYRTVMNCNSHGGQTVYHIHCHLLAGRAMAWPPG